VEALEQLLAGKSVSRPVVEPVGCIIGRTPRATAKTAVTFSGQISRIFHKHCVTCHRPGSIAPFSLMRYREAAGWAETIREVVLDRRMPPWDANPEHGCSLSEDTGCFSARKWLAWSPTPQARVQSPLSTGSTGSAPVSANACSKKLLYLPWHS